MSLVEKAIKKLQEAAPPQPAPDAVFGKVVATGAHKVLPTAPLRPVSERILAIDQAALRIAGLMAPEHQERQISQQYRQIKRPLIANALGRGTKPLPNGHLIMMASAMPGEGKTFTSLNLAFSLALEKDLRVLLVDADLPKPHISKLLGVESEPGLLDALRDSRLDVEQLILPTNIPGLSVLPAGKQFESATELLASDRMQEIATSFTVRDPRRIVLLDSPPLLLTTESQALSQVAGQIVVVVRAEFTPQNVLLDAISHLGEGKSISLILNQSTRQPRGGYYYYGYGETESGSRKPS